jgi:hypothetical protein
MFDMTSNQGEIRILDIYYILSIESKYIYRNIIYYFVILYDSIKDRKVRFLTDTDPCNKLKEWSIKVSEYKVRTGAI